MHLTAREERLDAIVYLESIRQSGNPEKYGNGNMVVGDMKQDQQMFEGSPRC